MEILDLLNEESVSGACSGRASLINSTRSPTTNVKKVSQSLKYDSNIFFIHKHTHTHTHIYITEKPFTSK